MSVQELMEEYEIAETPVPELTDLERKVALQYRWHQTFNASMGDIPEDLETLCRLIPPVSEGEVRKFLYAALEQAKTTFLKALNTSWATSQLEKNLNEAGVAGALEVFDEKTREHLKGVIRYLPII
jgi:hypothetical protein